MPPGDEQQEVGEIDIICQPSRQRVAFEMINSEEWLTGAPSEALRHHRADDQTTDQTGSCSSCQAIDLGKRNFRLGEGLHHDSVEMIEMGAGGDLGDHAPIRGVLAGLHLD